MYTPLQKDNTTEKSPSLFNPLAILCQNLYLSFCEETPLFSSNLVSYELYRNANELVQWDCVHLNAFRQWGKGTFDI